MRSDNQNKPWRTGYFARLVKPEFIFELIISLAFLGFSLWTLFYYVTGPALGYFHSDCVDSLLWSQAMVESGDILSENFSYAALLPFGSPIWMVPVIKLFGFTMRAQTVSMCIFTVIFVLSALSLFRAMRWRYSVSSTAVFCLSMILSGSVKLREIMWEHVIYYSLGILFIMLLLSLVFRLWDKLSDFSRWVMRDKISAVIYGVLLLLLCAGCATDGFQVLGLTVVPVVGSIIAYTLFDKETKLNSPVAVKRYSICVVMALGTLMGILLLSVITNGGQISAGYGVAYSGWSDVSSWRGNAELFLTHYLTLVGVETDTAVSLFSADSIAVFIRLIGALAVLVCPFILFFSYKSLKDKYSKIIAWAHLAVTAVVMVGFICGTLSNVNWRLTPFLGSSVIATVVYVKHLIGEGVVMRRVGVLIAALLLCFSMANAADMLDMPRELGRDDPLQKVADTLEEKGYDYGYATFWNAGETWLRSDSAVKVVNVSVERGEVKRRNYQTMNHWFDDIEGQENYFLLLDRTEYLSIVGSSYWTELTSRRNIVEEFECEDYYVIVFDGNVFVD